jgi:two-component sensor histidine kinase
VLIAMQESTILKFGLQIQLRPRMVSVVRRFVEDAFEKIVGDPNAVFRVSLAVHELLENAAKYAVGDKMDLTVHFESDGAGPIIKLTNQTTPERIALLRARVSEIQSSNDPPTLYRAMMRRAADVQGESGLGLVRIRAEGELDLSLEIEGTLVTVTASCLPTRRPAA